MCVKTSQYEIRAKIHICCCCCFLTLFLYLCFCSFLIIKKNCPWTWSMTGGPWTRSMKVVHGPLVHVLSSPGVDSLNLPFPCQQTVSNYIRSLDKHVLVYANSDNIKPLLLKVISYSIFPSFQHRPAERGKPKFQKSTTCLKNFLLSCPQF